MKLQGQSALVSGGASGLGAQTARRLAAAGAKVAVLDLNEKLAGELAREIGGIAVACDVAEAQSAEAAVARAKEQIGVARVLVNCAGVAGAQRIVGRNGPMPLEVFERIIRINLIGCFNMMRLAANEMSKLEALEDGERGVIISTTSVAAYEGQLGQSAYAASKGGIVSLTLPAAREFAQFGIRVLAIAPGIFHTPLLYELPKEVQESLGASIPFPKRLGKPDEFARLVLHLIDNPYMNGEVVRLDGALRLPPR
ncbi:MAG: SDR family oxidoreductase [Betaproteobacteria bacterium]|nr:SDR family oxidoreductase [Betaproteobacteria bacterium]